MDESTGVLTGYAPKRPRYSLILVKAVFTFLVSIAVDAKKVKHFLSAQNIKKDGVVQYVKSS